MKAWAMWIMVGFVWFGLALGLCVSIVDTNHLGAPWGIASAFIVGRPTAALIIRGLVVADRG